MKTQFLALSVIALSSLNGFSELPTKSQAILDKLAEYEKAEEEAFRSRLTEKRNAVAELLRAHLDEETKKGNLDGALALKNLIQKLGPKESTSETTEIPPAAIRVGNTFLLPVKATTTISFSEAKANAEKAGGLLFVPESKKELEFFETQMKGTPAWLAIQSRDGKTESLDGKSVRLSSLGIKPKEGDVPAGQKYLALNPYGNYFFYSDVPEFKVTGYLVRFRALPD